jgi:glutamate synthase domain-containing protein 3
MNIGVEGRADNISHLLRPQRVRKVKVFGKSKAKELAKAAKDILSGKLPIDPDLAKLCHEGKVEKYSSGAVSELFAKMVTALNGKAYVGNSAMGGHVVMRPIILA